MKSRIELVGGPLDGAIVDLAFDDKYILKYQRQSWNGYHEWRRTEDKTTTGYSIYRYVGFVDHGLITLTEAERHGEESNECEPEG